MICRNCSEEYDQEMFEICPYCLAANDVIETENIDEAKSTDIKQECDTNSAVIDICNLKETGETQEVKEIDDVVLKTSCAEQVEQYASIEDGSHKSYEADEFVQEKMEIFGTNEPVLIENISELSVRSKRALRRRGIFTLEYLKDYVIDNNLMKIPNLGVKSVSEIERVLELYRNNALQVMHEEVIREEAVADVKVYKKIGEELKGIDITLLKCFGIYDVSIKNLIANGICKIGDLENCNEKDLKKCVGNSYEKLKETASLFESGYIQLIEYYFDKNIKSNTLEIVSMRYDGYTLQEIGEYKAVTRERIRQITQKFMLKTRVFMIPVFEALLEAKGFIKLQELLEMFDNKLYGKSIALWCKKYERMEYFDFAEIFVAGSSLSKYKEYELLLLITEFIGENANFYDCMEEVEMLLNENGFGYLDVFDILNLLQKYGYKSYGKYVIKGKQPYAYLCSKIVATKFPNGIKLYDSHDLDLLREYVLQEYGEVKIPEQNRAFSMRLLDYLVLSDRGSATAIENIYIENEVLEEIKEYIDTSPEDIIYYRLLFAEFEGKLKIMSNISNHNFLHGVLMLYYPDDYIYSRDFMKKKGYGYLSGKISDVVKRYIHEKGKPVHKEEIKKKFAIKTDMMLYTAITTDNSLMIWDYNYYFTLDLLTYTEHDLDALKNIIQNILRENNGYCSEEVLYAAIKQKQEEFLVINRMTNAHNLFYFCSKNFGNEFSFKRPHIRNLNNGDTMEGKSIALEMLGHPGRLRFSDFYQLINKFKWPEVTASMIFQDIEEDYIRVSDDVYIRKDLFVITDQQISDIDVSIEKYMHYGFVSLITFDYWDELPEICYEWNVNLLSSIIQRYSKRYKIIAPRSKDRRYEKGMIVKTTFKGQEYVDLVVCFLNAIGKTKITERELLSVLLVNGLTYKMIPKEIYISDKIVYQDETFRIV